MRRANEKERDAYLVELFQKPDLPECFERARLAYRGHLMALGLTRIARATRDRQQIKAAEKIAGRCRARWRRCREAFTLFTSEKGGMQ